MSSPSYRYTLGAAFSYDEEGPDLSQPLTYNSSFHRADVTPTLAEAWQRLVMLSKQHANLTEELRLVLTPKLLKLVDEEEWLLQQEALAANSSNSEAVAATASGGGAAQPARADAGNDPGATALAAGGGEAGAATAGAVAKASGSKWAKTRDSEDRGSTSDAGRKSGSLPPTTRRVLRSEAPKPQKKRRPRSQPPVHPDAAAADGGRSGPCTEGNAHSEVLQPDSPWAAEIEELDERVFKMQGEVKRLEWDIWAIQAAGAVRGFEEALGRAVHILPDEHFMTPDPLGTFYKKCAESSRSKQSSSPQKAFRHLVTPWRESFAFKRAARKQIPQWVLDRILELNSLDQELWELGSKLLEAKLAEQQAAGVLEDFEPPAAGAGAGGEDHDAAEGSTQVALSRGADGGAGGGSSGGRVWHARERGQ